MSADDDLARAANPGSDPLLLARLAEERPDLRAVLAGNPSTPVYILEWLHSLREPAIDRSLAANRTAIIMGIARPVPGSSLAPPIGEPLASPPGEPVPLTAVIPVAPVDAVGAPAARTVVPGPAAAVVPPPAPPPPERRRGIGLLVAVVPLLFLGGCLAAIALARGGNDSKKSATASSAARATVTSLANQVLPTQVTKPSTPDPSTGAPAPTAAPTPPPSAPPVAESAPEDTPDETTPATQSPTRTAAARTSATTAKAATTTTKATPTVAPTTAAAAPTVAPANVQSFAFTIAQNLATALANGDWAKARTLSPTSGSTDAQYQSQYGNLDASTVIPAKAAVLSVTTYSLRIGLVAHETNSGVKQTSLYCAHWNVDTAKGIVTQVSGKKLRSENGTKAATAYTAELANTCASTALA